MACAWFSRGRDLTARGAETSGGEWRLTIGRARMASAVVGDTFWILGGLDAGHAPRASAEYFDLTRNPTRKSVANLSMSLLARYDQTAQAAGNDIYIVGGLDTFQKVQNTLEKLDTSTGVITTLAPMPTPRRMAHSVIYGGKIYVIGGSNAVMKRVTTLEIYDIAKGTWKRGAPMQVARECDVALWKGQIIVAGGYNGNASTSSSGVLRDVECYDIATDKWRQIPALTQPISAHHAVVSGDWVFLFGDYLTLSRVLAYNARTGKTRELADCGFAPRRHVVAAAYKGRAYVVGGNADDNQAPLDEVQIFDLKKLQQMAQATPAPK